MTRCFKASATPSSTFLSSSTSSPSRIQPNVLAGRAGDVAHESRERGDDAAHRHHRQAHRAVAHECQPAARIFDELAQLVARALHLVGHRHDVVDRGLDVERQRGPVRRDRIAQRAQPALLLGRQRDDPLGVLFDPACVEFGFADDVEQVVHALRCHPHRVDRAFATAIHR